MTGEGSLGWLTPSAAGPLEGDEQFIGLDATVAEFWRWAFSDLRDNFTRGILAEFLVSRAVGDSRGMRISWDNFDVLAPDGTRIEVKCSAFLQSWTLRRHSELRFGRLSAREFDATRNEYSVDVKVRADVFVFAVQTQLEPAEYDMLDLSHWEFWVIDASPIRELAIKAVGISWVRQHADGPHPYSELAEAIRAAGRPPAARLPGTGAMQARSALLQVKLQEAGSEVVTVAGYLRALGGKIGLSVVPDAASLSLRDRRGTLVRLYPTFRSLEFPLELLWQAGCETEIGEIRDALDRIAGKHVTARSAMLGCHEALANWDALVEIVQYLVRLRAENGP